MITARYCREMARYNLWQNTAVRAALRGLPWSEVTADRGVFFGSIWATANHVLWGDRVWMSRFDGWPAPEGGPPDFAAFTPDLDAWDAARAATDQGILAWAEALEEASLAGDLSWYSGASKRAMVKPMALCIMGFFNHQTHHRGQIHAVLTRAGWTTDDTDLFLMPDLDA